MSNLEWTEPRVEWFDQFDDLMPEGWEHHQWCWRHWAPAVIMGANGIAATLTVVQRILDLAPADVTTPGINKWMDDLGKLCCTMGDEKMYDIWGKCPPPGYETKKS